PSTVAQGVQDLLALRCSGSTGNCPVRRGFGEGSSACQFEWIGGLAQTHLGEADSRRIVKENAILLARPDGIGPQQTRASHVEAQPARFTAACDQSLPQGSLFRVEGIVAAQGRVDVAPQLFQARKRGDSGHGDSAISGRYGGVARHGPPPYLSTPPEAEST